MLLEGSSCPSVARLTQPISLHFCRCVSSHQLSPNVFFFFFFLACLVKHNPYTASFTLGCFSSLNLWTKSATIYQGPWCHFELLHFFFFTGFLLVKAILSIDLLFLSLDSEDHGEDTLASRCPFSTMGDGAIKDCLVLWMVMNLTEDEVIMMAIFFFLPRLYYFSHFFWQTNPFPSSLSVS